MSRPSQGRRLRTMAALIIGGALIATGSTTATAATEPAADTKTAVDTKKQGNLFVHRYDYVETPTGLPNDGRELSAAELAGLSPVAGTVIDIRNVPGIDLSTAQGRADAAAMTQDEALAAIENANGESILQSRKTDASGTAKFDRLALGLYYVTERDTPNYRSSMRPFLVTVPLNDPIDKTKLLYDVHVYPKGEQKHAGKTVADAATYTVGESVKWTITAPIPYKGTDGFQIVDDLDKRLGEDTSLSLQVNGVSLTSTDYTRQRITSGAQPQLVITLTAIGRAKVNTHKGGTLALSFNTVVKEAGVITNVAKVYDSAKAIASKQPTEVTPVATTKFGSFTVETVDAIDASPLKGAIYKVYKTKADADADRSAISINGVSTWTNTAASNKALIRGLRFSNWENNAEISTRQSPREYWLVQVTAPQGYERYATPVSFLVTHDDQKAVDLTVKNSAESNAGFELPLTGGSGTTALSIGGGALLLGGLLFFMLRKRREAQTVSEAVGQTHDA